MSSISALHSGIQGIQQGLRDLDRNAAKIVSKDQFTSQNASDLTEPLVNLELNKLQVAASAKVIKAVDETIGTILDLKV